MRFVLLVILFTMACGFTSLSARVGETLEQCFKRYGKPTLGADIYNLGEQGKELTYFNFVKRGIAVQIGFLNGKAADLSFHHLPPDTAPGDPTPPPVLLTQVEIDTLLTASSDGKHWKYIQDGKLVFLPDTSAPKARYGPYQQRDDGVMATVDGPTLHIFTPEWMTYINERTKAHALQEKEDQKKNLEGF